ncbi:MAG: hypothetical protein MZU95_02885 [Desulfomicrobium escambiense]|nr:hypothetical protein [Desulfomicrobium escambiense]
MDEADATRPRTDSCFPGTLIEPDENEQSVCHRCGLRQEARGVPRGQTCCATLAHLHRTDWQGSTWPPDMCSTGTSGTWSGGMSTEFFPGFYSDPDLSMKLWQTGVRFFKGVGASRAVPLSFRDRTKGAVRKRPQGLRLQVGHDCGASSTKQYLRRGQPRDGPLREPAPGLFQRLKNGISRGF